MKVDDKIMKAINSYDGSAFKLLLNGKKYLTKKEYFFSILSQGDTSKQSILDIGCCGHIRNIDSQMVNGTWLHSKFDSFSKYNIGVDINQEAVRYLNEKYNRKDVYCLNILNDNDREKLMNLIPEKRFDYIILSDIIEHTCDPIGFLKTIVDSNIAKNFIISVPNAFHIINTIFAVKENAETINSDHKFWFSPFTLIKCANEAGIIVDDIDVCDYKIKYKFLGRLLRKKIMGATVVISGHIK